MSLVSIIVDILTFKRTEMTKLTAISTEQEYIFFIKSVDDFSNIKYTKIKY